MIKLNRIWDDVSRGENIDLYIALLASISLAFLSVLGIDIQKYISSITLTVLALIAYSTLNNRFLIEKFEYCGSYGIGKVLLTDWPEQEIKLRIRECQTLFIVGPILLRTMKYYTLYEEKLKSGANIRILLVDPNSVAADIIGSRPYSNVDLNRTKNEINGSIKSLERLAKETKGKLEFRTINYPLSYGGLLFDIDLPNGKIFVKYYPFKMREEDRPRLVLLHENGYWFNFYKTEVETLWDHADIHKA